MSAERSWLVLLYSLPLKKASERVEIWRKLKRYGALPLHTSGYVLPFSPENQEHFEWLATSIRKYQGEASVLHVAAIDNLPAEKLAQRFLDARSKDYKVLLSEFRGLHSSRPEDLIKLRRLRKKFHEISQVDFFETPIRRKLDALFNKLEGQKTETPRVPAGSKRQYRARLWVTRPSPGIDRVASAWLIRKFIDPQARFAFAPDASRMKDAVSFDMFHSSGFGHRGDDCTFETLCKEFHIADLRVRAIAEMVHDADLGDEKFGRTEALGIERILRGWKRKKLTDRQLLERGIDLIEGVYLSL